MEAGTQTWRVDNRYQTEGSGSNGQASIERLRGFGEGGLFGFRLLSRAIGVPIPYSKTEQGGGGFRNRWAELGIEFFASVL